LVNSLDTALLKRRARRRLVGAIALVLFFVILLPIVLDQEPRSVTQTLTVQIPSQDAGRFNTRVLPPLAPPAAPQREPTQSSKSAPEKQSEPARPEPKPAKATARSGSRATGVKNDARAESREVAKAGNAESRRAGSLLNDDAYVVPLGAYANPENVKNVQEKAASAGIKSYTEQIKGAQGDQTRVRAGPFKSREAAEIARDQLKSLGLATGEVAQR
jgi:DedD protein